MKTDLEYILDFCTELTRRMLASGANLERVTLAIQYITEAYGLEELSLFLLTTHISISARDSSGNEVVRQADIPEAGIHLDRLTKLNRLCFKVSRTTPDPAELSLLLEEADRPLVRPDWVILLGQLAALSCLCFIFGGSFAELLPVLLVVALVHYMLRFADWSGVENIITNFIVMFAGAVVLMLASKLNIAQNGAAMMITLIMLLLPGIPLVNSIRNLLSGNEMNGILQFLKVTVETFAMGAGIYVAVKLFGGFRDMGDVFVTPLSNPGLLVLLTFFSAVGFGVVFNIPFKDLWKAGIGGMMARIVLIAMQQVTDSRFIYIFIAALAASLYAEGLATKEEVPSTYYVYPAIIPLIPGDQFYYTIVSVYTKDLDMFLLCGFNTLVALVAMGVGFVTGWLIARRSREYRHKKRAKQLASE